MGYYLSCSSTVNHISPNQYKGDKAFKATIYRDSDLCHPMQRMIELCTDLTIDPDNSVHSELDMDKLIEIIENEDGRPEIS